MICALAALAACRPSSSTPAPWLYDATLALGPRPPVIGSFGRGVRPLALIPAGMVAGPALGQDELPAALTELIGADDGAAEALAYGMVGGQPVLELIDVDGGVVRWRNRTTALTPRSLAGDVLLAGDDTQTAGLERTSGAERWRFDGAFRGRDGALVALAASDGVVLVNGRDGQAGVALLPPGGVPAAAVMAVCAARPPAMAPHLYAWRDRRLMRWDVEGALLRETWAVDAEPPARLDACGATVLLLGGEPRAVTAFDPASGAVVAGPVAAREMWPARSGDGIELATAGGVEQRDRRLGGAVRLEPVRVGRLIARRGARRLVARGDGGLVLLDEHGARAIAEPHGVGRAALGDRYLVGGTWVLPARSLAARPTRYLLPAAGAEAAPLPPLGDVLIGDPPRIDVPAGEPLPAAVAFDSAGAWSVGDAIVDPADPARVYVQVLEARPSETSGAGLAAFDLRRNRWLWHAPAACPPGTPVALAVTSRAVLCGAVRNTPGTGGVRAVDRGDGSTRWDWRGITVDGVIAAGRVVAPSESGLPGIADPADVVLVTEGARVVVLDPATGGERASWRATDGWLPRIAVVRRERDVTVASLEHGRVVLRSAAFGLRPFASVEVRGVVSAMFTAGERVAVALTDGTVYLVDERGAAVAAGGLSPVWDTAGDLVVATTRRGGEARGTSADGVMVAYGGDGVPRFEATVPGSGPLGLAPRVALAGAPVALLSSGGGVPRITVLTAAGRAARAIDLPHDAPRTPVVATAVDGAGVVAAFLARPLRLVRIDVAAQ